MFFDNPVQDNFRARVANEYSRLLNEAERAGRNTKSFKVIDELDLLANKNVTDLDNQTGSRPVRNAAKQAKGQGGGLYSELHYFA